MLRNLALLGLVAVLTLAAGWFGGDIFVVRRVNRLVGVARRLAGGDMAARSGSPHGRGEIDQLARVFDEMAQSLQHRQAESKRAEEELRKSRDELEKRVEDRAKELQKVQDRLARHEKLAALGQLASMVSHELRNPLGVIGNAAYYLSMKLKDADEKVIKHLEILQKEVQRSNNIIVNLLDFSRAGPLTLVQDNVNSIIKDALTDIAAPENIAVETRLDDDLPDIPMDSDQIRRLFMNIIANAVQAMPEGGRLEIRSGAKEDFVEITVKDTGEGISDENLQKIFDPLFSAKTRGIGLGLSIAKDIVEGHKGSIEVESEAGNGATFAIRLPIRRQNEAKNA